MKNLDIQNFLKPFTSLAVNLNSCSVKELKSQQVYLNNAIPDSLFIDIVNSYGLSSYYEMFPSDTKDKALLIEYITLTEVILISSFKFNIYQSSPVESLLSKKMKKDLVD